MVNWKYVFAFQTMVRFMESHFREKITLNDISGSAGYSPSRCKVLFRTYLGQAPFDRLRSIRMQAAKADLKASGSVEKTALGLAFSSADAFSRAFRKEYGITPSEYLKGGTLQERYAQVYEYRKNDEAWYSGANPDPEGLWEYDYYDPADGRYRLMEWFRDYDHFRAPCARYDKGDPHWYCRVRQNGFGMHAGAGAHAVKTFLCPHSGRVELFASVGRFHLLRSWDNGCFCQWFLNGRPISEPAYMQKYPAPDFLRASCTVKKGDRISLHLAAMDGNIDRTGTLIFWQRISYLSGSDKL